jgi:hypothetical protein
MLMAILAVGAGLQAGTANAADSRLWREQVARNDDSVIVLESESTDRKDTYGADWRLWREQVKITGKTRVFVVQPAGQRFARTNDSRLWREQIKIMS